MTTSTLEWNWRGANIRLDIASSGTGPALLLLPALSSISTHHEMGPLAEHLAPRYSTVCVDWPGFGGRARPQVDWTPDAYSAFLAFLLTSVVPHPHAVIAAGHAASYALKYAASAPQATTRLVLIAPTWRGPLPTVLGERRPLLDRLRRLVDLPGIGPLVYRLNVNEFVVRRMGAGHVYTDPAFLTGERLHQKLAVVRAPGARFASARFVTGALDPLEGRDGFLDLGRRARIPILLIYGAETPPRSRAEMEALAANPGIRSITLPRGKLSVHEEFPGAVFDAMDAFLRE
jgi:pimeloyl-ACP methyl ester carboxylesterase